MELSYIAVERAEVGVDNAVEDLAHAYVLLGEATLAVIALTAALIVAPSWKAKKKIAALLLAAIAAQVEAII